MAGVPREYEGGGGGVFLIEKALTEQIGQLYWVAGQDVAQETAALASAAHSAYFSVSCAKSCPVTQFLQS